MAKKRSIFRKKALERLSSPEQLDLLMHVTSPRSWLALGGMIALIIIAIVWGFVGRIPVEVTGEMILLRSGGVKNIVSSYDGQITNIMVQPGAIVEKDAPVAMLQTDGNTETITSPFNGRVLELKTDVGDLVSAGKSVASMEFAGDEVGLEAIMYLPPSDGKLVREGMDVKISPVTAPAEQYGYLLGQVTYVADFPATHEGMQRTLGSNELIEALVSEEAPIEVRITLIPQETTPSGYKWSLSPGPTFTVDSGTLGQAHIEIAQQRPINLVLPLR